MTRFRYSDRIIPPWMGIVWFIIFSLIGIAAVIYIFNP